MKKLTVILHLAFPAAAQAGPLLTTLREARPFTAEELIYLLPVLLLVIGIFLLIDYWWIKDRKKSDL